MKQSELFEKFAACVKMVEDSGVDIKVRTMVRLDGCECGFIPTFDSSVVKYTFAVGIIENTPVFVGDTVYHERNGECVITKTETDRGTKYFYYIVNGNTSSSNGNWNSSVSAFSMKSKNSIKLEDVKAFAIFSYDGTSEVMVSPANYHHNGQMFILTGLNGSFGLSYSTNPKTQKEMYEYLIDASGYSGKGYIKTNKRFGLIEGETK